MGVLYDDVASRLATLGLCPFKVQQTPHLVVHKQLWEHEQEPKSINTLTERKKVVSMWYAWRGRIIHPSDHKCTSLPSTTPGRKTSSAWNLPLTSVSTHQEYQLKSSKVYLQHLDPALMVHSVLPRAWYRTSGHPGIYFLATRGGGVTAFKLVLIDHQCRMTKGWQKTRWCSGQEVGLNTWVSALMFYCKQSGRLLAQKK